MAPKNKKKGTAAPKKSNAANKEDLDGLDELLSNPDLMAQFEDKTQRPVKREGASAAPRPPSGAESARIGMEGFKQATANPAMFAEAMGMLNDPNAVKEAQQMMQDEDFKREMQKHMAALKSDPSFQDAMRVAQTKFQEIMKDPNKLQELQQQYAGLTGAAGANGAALTAPTEGAAEAEAEAANGAVADPGIDDAEA